MEILQSSSSMILASLSGQPKLTVFRTRKKSVGINILMDNSEKVQQSDRTYLPLSKIVDSAELKPDPNKHFALVKVLATGKFGYMYLGYHRGSRTITTFKIFRPWMGFFPNKAAKLEKRLLSLKIKPIMFPRLITSFSYEFQQCLVMERVACKTLKDKLKFARRLPEMAIRFYMTEIIFAISFLHSKQIIHRNLNLDSFWIQADGHLKLMDFSLCIPFNTLAPRLMWTFYPNHFTPPEVVVGGIVTKMMDIWAIGVIMYRMTTGKMPFLAATRADFKSAIRYASVNFNHHFTTEAQHFCAALLAKYPMHRLGYNTSTFSAMASHEYFTHTNWEKVLTGSTQVPETPILFGNDMSVLECDLNLLTGIHNKLRKKPLRYDEITTKKAHEIFSDANLLEHHRRKIAKDIKRQKRKQMPQDFSYLKVTMDDHLWSMHSSSPIDRRDHESTNSDSFNYPSDYTEDFAPKRKYTAFDHLRQHISNITLQRNKRSQPSTPV